jgi:hypothetical protein
MHAIVVASLHIGSFPLTIHDYSLENNVPSIVDDSESRQILDSGRNNA